MKTINHEIFDLVKIKPISQVLGISQSRFTQKLYNYKIKGRPQAFTSEELDKIKLALNSIVGILDSEINEN